MTAAPIRALARAVASDGRGVALADGAIVVGPTRDATSRSRTSPVSPGGRCTSSGTVRVC